jgi:hypothetical protein
MACLLPALPPHPRQSSATSSGKLIVLLSSTMTALNRLSSATGATSASKRTCVSRSNSRSTKATASGVKRWCQPLEVISTSRRWAICVKPSKVISGSSNQPKMSVWARVGSSDDAFPLNKACFLGQLVGFLFQDLS